MTIHVRNANNVPIQIKSGFWTVPTPARLTTERLMQPRERKLVPVATYGESPFCALVTIGFRETQGESEETAHLGRNT